MRALLDTNIIIHRENKRVSNYSIGHLFRWLDKLKYDKIIHPYSIQEIRKYKDPEAQEVLEIKLESYNILQTVIEPSKEFLQLIDIPEKSPNDKIDDTLLFELYTGRVDILITEDLQLINKANKIGLGDQAFTINSFIAKVTAENPTLIEYKALSVKKTRFGEIDINDSFFDSLKAAYNDFNRWFMRKCDEEAYICRNADGKILGFLYIKVEEIDENYSDIQPAFTPKRRLKIGTFKVESTGFRLGERFLKIVFDNAIQYNVDEIYITLFDQPEIKALYNFIKNWGFIEYGQKQAYGKTETVLVKTMKKYTDGMTCKQNYPNIRYNVNKYILPILPEYHTSLLPDSILRKENEIDFLGKEPHRYALQKVYISWAFHNGAKPGDLVVFYRIGPEGSIKKYTSVITTIGVVDEIITNIYSEEQLLRLCQNRSVFSKDDLHLFWRKHPRDIKVLKFIFSKSLNKRLTLEYLWKHDIIQAPQGPRPFTKITDEQFNMIIHDTETEITFVDR